MCGRAVLTTAVEDIAQIFEVDPIPIGPPRFNIAPGTDVAVVRVNAASSSRELALVRWGLVPWWSKDVKMGQKCIQARAETLAKAPAFRDAFKNKRCLVVVDGFYEWSGTGKARVPHHVQLAGGGPFAIAGVWDSWNAPDGSKLESCAVVTTAARGPLAELHDRMPLVLDGEARDRWLSAGTFPGDVPAPFVIAAVSTWVNDVRHDDPRCLEPPGEVAAPAQTTLGFE